MGAINALLKAQNKRDSGETSKLTYIHISVYIYGHIGCPHGKEIKKLKERTASLITAKKSQLWSERNFSVKENRGRQASLDYFAL